MRQDEVVDRLRELCGPHDPQYAKSIKYQWVKYIGKIQLEQLMELIKLKMLFIAQIYLKMEY